MGVPVLWLFLPLLRWEMGAPVNMPVQLRRWGCRCTCRYNLRDGGAGARAGTTSPWGRAGAAAGVLGC